MAINPVKARGQVSLAKLYDGTNGKDGKDGAQGVPGAPGADGKTTYVHVAYADSADGKTNFSTTDPTDRKYIGVLTDFSINDSTDYRLYTWSLAQGPIGPTGATGTPGAKGEDGRTTYIHVAYSDSADGTTSFSTTDPTNRAYIGVLTDFNLNDSTTPSDYTWSLAKGADGAQGEQGIPGPVGANGKNTYVHFAYANSVNGATSFSTTDPTGRAYIGVLTDFNLNDSTNYADYTWSLAKGADGTQGIPGPVGPDGRTSYVHFAYATSADGSTGFSTTDPTGASYIGTYTDFTINDSTNYKSYTWSRMKGDTGNGIANTVIEYQITNTQDQPSDTSGWTTTIPNIGAGVYLWTRTTFMYTDGTKSRTYTVSRQSDNVYTAVLTNDSITLPSDTAGNVTDFSGANGSFLVYDGAYQVDSSTIKVQVAQQVNVTVTVGGNNYSITAMDKTKDSGYFDLSYTYKGVLLTKRVSVSKSKRGTDGSNPVIVNLSATSQVFTFDSNNKPYPVNQNINFSTTVSGTNDTPVYIAIPYDENGVAGSAIVLGSYGTGGKQLQVAQIGNYQRVVVTVTVGGGTDSTTIVRVKDGSSVSPIPDPSNTVSSSTPPTNPKEGDWWNDTSQTPNVLKYRYRDKWVQYELDGYYVKANSISGEAIVTNTLEAQKIKYTNSDGTTTNLQTFDLKGIQTAMTDSSGHTYTSMDNAVSSTQTWKSTNNKLDNLQVGGRNWLLESKTPKSAAGNNTSNQSSFYYTFASGMTSGKMYTDWGVGSPFTVSFDWVVTGSTISGEFGPQLVSQPYGLGAPRVKVSSTNTSGHYVYTSTSIASNWAGTSANSLTFRLEYLQGTVTISNIKLEQGTFATTYTEAPEDVATWTQSQIKATADQINIGVSSAKSTADAATNKVNSLSVGGTNLLLGTKGFTDPIGTNPWSFGGGYTFTTDGPSGLIAHSNNQAWGGPKYRIRDLINRGVVNSTDTYMMSAWMKNTGTNSVIIGFYHSTSTISLNPATDVVATLPPNSGWVRVISPIISISDSALTTTTSQSFRFEPKVGVVGGYIQQAGLKLERGNLPTSWSPAPEDVPQVNQAYNTDLGSNTAGWDISPYMKLDTSTGIVTYNRTDLTGTSSSWQGLRQIDSLVMPVKVGDPVSASVFVVSSPVAGSLPTASMIFMTVEFTKLDGSVQQNFTKDISNLTNTRVINSNIIAPTGAVSARLKIETNGNTSFSFKQPMLVKSYTVGDYTPGFPYSGIQGGRNYVLSSSGTNAMDSSRPVLMGSTSDAYNATVTYQPDGITLTNLTTNKTTEWAYQVAKYGSNFVPTPLNPGQTFTFSADVMGTVPQAVLRWGFQGTGGYESFQAFKINNATTWQRISVTLTPPTGATGLFLRIQGGINGQYQTGWSGGETLRFRNVKVEDGSVATAWSPAPEDLVTTANSASYRYLRFKGEGNNENGGTHFSEIEVLNTTGTNLLAGKIYTTWGTGPGTVSQAAGNATDGNFNTYIDLSSGFINSNQFIVYDLGSQRFDLDKLRMTMWTGYRTYYGVLAQASADGVNWTTIFKGNIDNTTLYNGIVSATVSFGTSLAPVQAAQSTATTANNTANSAQATAKAVTDKVNSLSVGGRNLLLDTATRTAVGPNVANNTPSDFRWTLAGGIKVGDLYTAWGNNAPISLSFDWAITGTTISGTINPQWSSAPWGIGTTGAPGITVSSTNTSGHYTWSSTTQPGWSGSTANMFTCCTDNLQGTLTISNLKFEQGNLPTAWSPSPEDVDGAIKKVSNDLKLTVDGYSLGTTVDGKLVSGFTGNQQQVTIKGNMVNLDANTVVGNNFILQSANIGDLTAGKIKTGSIVGNNLNINLDTGAVLFQKGRIYSQGKEIDINIDQNYIRSYGKFGAISLEDGAIYLSGPVYDKPIVSDGPSIDLYLYIQSVLMPSLAGQPEGYIGASIFAKDFLQIGLKDFPIGEWIPGQTSNNLGTIISRQTGTSVYGKDIGVNIAGGALLNYPDGISFKTPRIAVGFNPTKDPTSMSTNPGDDLRSGGILLSADSVVLADASGTHGSITRDGIKTKYYTRYVTAQNDTQNLPLVMGLERVGNLVMVSFNFVTYGSTIRADAIQMNGPKIPVGFRPVDNVHIQAHANNSGTTLGTITFTITPEGKVLQTSPAINGGARVMGSGVYLTYSVSPSVGTKVDGSTGNTTA